MPAHNLVETWLAVATGSGEPIKHALEELNEDLGTRYSPHRFSEWRYGRRPLPQHVQDYMLRMSVERAVRAAGGELPATDEALDAVAEMLAPPRRRV